VTKVRLTGYIEVEDSHGGTHFITASDFFLFAAEEKGENSTTYTALYDDHHKGIEIKIGIKIMHGGAFGGLTIKSCNGCKILDNSLKAIFEINFDKRDSEMQ
jgi:hypothetical protein